MDPTAAQKSAVSRLNATARWNQFGTPRSLINHDGLLASGVRGINAQNAARNFLAANAAVFGLPADYLRSPENLEFVNDARTEESNGHAGFFRQGFGGLSTVKAGSVIVGLKGRG